MGHGGEGWQNVIHWRKEWQTTSVFLPWEPHEQYEKAKSFDTERWTLQVGSAQYVTGEEWRNNFRENEETEPKQKQCPVVDVTGDGSRVRCCRVNPLANINWAPDNAKHYLVCFTFTFLFNLYTTVCSLCYYMCYKWKVKVQWKCSESVSLSHVQLFTTPWAGAHQAPLFVEFSR